MKYILFMLVLCTMVSLWTADFRFAKELFNDGLYGEALLELERVVREKPTSSEAEEAIFLIGESYRKQEQFGAAENAYLRLWNGYPSSVLRDKTLLQLARVQIAQNRFIAAKENFQLLFTEFPMSHFTQQAPADFLHVLFKLEQHDQVILEANRLIQNYAKNEQIPDVYLWLIKSYFAKNLNSEGETALQLLLKNYSQTNAYWKAIEFETQRLAKHKNTATAIEFLDSKLTTNIPRQFEENLRWQAANLFFEKGDFAKSATISGELISKFNFSLLLDSYLLLFMESQIHTKRFNTVIDVYNEHKKRIENSLNLHKFRMKLAEAYFYMNEFDKSQQLLSALLEEAKNDTILYEGKKLLAESFQKNNRAKLAIELYRDLAEKFAIWGESAGFHKKIGDIYFYTFRHFSQAKAHYQKALTIGSKLDEQAELYYQIALCEEASQNYRAAYEYLLLIDEKELQKTDLRNQITAKKEFLHSFQIKDLDTAVEKLITALLEKSDPNEILINILANNLKEYEKALALLPEKETTATAYQRALLMLNLVKKNTALGNRQRADQYKRGIASVIDYLKMNNAAMESGEISLRFALINESAPNAETIKAIKNYLVSYPDSPVYNEFTFILANHYLKSEITQAIPYLKAIQNLQPIQEQQFVEAKISLAEYYYQQKNFAEAISVYQPIALHLHFARPNNMFHYLASQMEVFKIKIANVSEHDEYINAQKELEKLVNNVHDFSEYKAAINYLAESFRIIGNYQKAVIYTQRIENKNDEDYLLLSKDYIKINNSEAAKEALLYVQNKNYEQLKQLGILQFETADWVMAKYTFEQLIQKKKTDAENYLYLGHLFFLQANYTKSVENLELFFTHKAAETSSERAAKELAISLFQIKNRPRAESIWKQYKKDLNQNANHEIELYEAVYYKDIDAKKAEKSLSSLIKDADEMIKMKAYFWRGVINLEQKKQADAKSDFEKALLAKDKELVNEANLKLGTIYFSEENFQKSLHHYYQVIQSDEKGELALNAAQNFAIVCKTIEEWQKAIEAYEIILARWGDKTLQAKTLFDIAFCYYRDKKYDSAIEMFNQAIPLLQDKEMEAEAQYWIAESYFGTEQYEKAITEFLKVSFNYSRFPHWAASAELRSGEIYFQIRQIERAISIYERVISKYGRSSDWGKQAQERLNQMKN